MVKLLYFFSIHNIKLQKQIKQFKKFKMLCLKYKFYLSKKFGLTL